MIVIIKIVKRYRLKYNEIDKYDFWRETSSLKVEPVYAGYLLKVEDININSILLTLFKLEDKGIINIDIINNRYYLKLKDNLSIEEFKRLQSYERKIIKVFFKSIDDKNVIDLKEVLKKFDKEYEYKIILDEIYDEIKNECETKYLKK